MKTKKLFLLLFLGLILLGSCTVSREEYVDEGYEAELRLNDLVSRYDLWYVDFHRTLGTPSIPFMSTAFTVSFVNGQMYANNNIVDIGRTGNGLGVRVGNYSTVDGFLQINHTIDGFYEFEVYELSSNEIRITNTRENVSYFLIGYRVNHFDYDKLFYENIEYFLQEYEAWEKQKVILGEESEFDAENYLLFTPENSTTFYSSLDRQGKNVDDIQWDFTGEYEVFDVENYEDLKILTLNYDGGVYEEFELSVINDGRIRLFNVNSESTYEFEGIGFIQYLKNQNSSVRNQGRKRTIINRETKVRQYKK